MDGFVEAKEAAGAAQTHVNLGKTCTCMHILRATSDPQGHHERANRTGGQAFLCFYDNKKDAQRPYDHFAGGIAPRSLLCVRKQAFSFLPCSDISGSCRGGPLVFPVPGPHVLFNVGLLGPL